MTSEAKGSLRIGFCGLGKMGLPMTHRLLEAGKQVAVWNRSAEKGKALEEAAPTLCKAYETPAGVSAHADVLLFCLADRSAIEATVFGPDGLASGVQGSRPIVVDHSTITPAQTREFAKRWNAETGGEWIDAPVSGGTAGAAAGTLAIMAGGSSEAVGDVSDILALYAANITRMGEVGAGQATKLANQTIVMTTIAAIAEATVLAQSSGVEAGRLPAALAGGWADSVLLQTLQPRMIVPPAKPTGSIRTMLKDMDAVEALAAESGVQLPIAKRVRDWLAKAVEDGLGESDISQIVIVRRH
jgi:3-hydroxyisobutyrate dehydrogenase-like beta-hydroxyacid dehydrogenase